MTLDPIREPKRGEPTDAEWAAKVARRCNREITGQDFFEDEYCTILMGESAAAAATEVIYFELTETLTAGSTTGATAYKRVFDSSANAGEGGYTTGTTEITVKDTREVGYEGASGAKGACIMKTANNGAFGEIVDMECP